MAASNGTTQQDEFPPQAGPWQVQGHKAYSAMYQQSIEQPDAFWSAEAAKLHWNRRWDTLSSKYCKIHGQVALWGCRVIRSTHLVIAP
jgi:hypothetical protein